jgi:hypothetical protein
LANINGHCEEESNKREFKTQIELMQNQGGLWKSQLKKDRATSHMYRKKTMALIVNVFWEGYFLFLEVFYVLVVC